MNTQDIEGKTHDPTVDKVGAALNAQRFQMIEDIARELAGDVVFPTSFDTAIRLRKELQNPDLSTAQIARLVSLEPLVATKLVNLANSVLYSPDGSPAKNLQSVISRLGVDLVRSTALGIAMNQMLRAKDIAGFSQLAHDLWEHSVRTACAARALARNGTRLPPEEALLAGLVHDLGAFYMLYRGVQYPELRIRPDTLQHIIVGWHESIGVTLLNALGMPEDVVEASIDHDQPRTLPDPVRNLSDLVYIANVLAGGHHAWSGLENEQNTSEDKMLQERFAEIIPLIEADSQAMLAVFS